MKTILAILLLTINSALATDQERELWLIKGKQVYCNFFPSIKDVFSKHKFPDFTWDSTANYKGYTASWAVFDKQLYLIGIRARVKGSEKILANTQVMKGMKFPVKVSDWSGVVSMRDLEYPGVIPSDSNADRAKPFDRVTTLKFKNGILVSSKFDEKVKRESE